MVFGYALPSQPNFLVVNMKSQNVTGVLGSNELVIFMLHKGRSKNLP